MIREKGPYYGKKNPLQQFPNNYYVSVELTVRNGRKTSTDMQNLCGLKYHEVFVEESFKKVWLHQAVLDVCQRTEASARASAEGSM